MSFPGCFKCLLDAPMAIVVGAVATVLLVLQLGMPGILQAAARVCEEPATAETNTIIFDEAKPNALSMAQVKPSGKTLETVVAFRSDTPHTDAAYIAYPGWSVLR